MASYNPSSKRLPSQMTELMDIAIFSFATLSGLRSSHKVRGDPVVDGVCSLFGRLLGCASDETKQVFQKVLQARLGGWEQGTEPTKELATFISSRLKQAKEKKDLRSNDEPCAPEPLVKEKLTFLEEKEQVLKKFYPSCWRCKSRCHSCKLRQTGTVPLRSLKSE